MDLSVCALGALQWEILLSAQELCPVSVRYGTALGADGKLFLVITCSRVRQK